MTFGFCLILLQGVPSGTGSAAPAMPFDLSNIKSSILCIESMGYSRSDGGSGTSPRHVQAPAGHSHVVAGYSGARSGYAHTSSSYEQVPAGYVQAPADNVQLPMGFAHAYSVHAQAPADNVHVHVGNEDAAPVGYAQAPAGYLQGSAIAPVGCTAASTGYSILMSSSYFEPENNPASSPGTSVVSYNAGNG